MKGEKIIMIGYYLVVFLLIALVIFLIVTQKEERDHYEMRMFMLKTDLRHEKYTNEILFEKIEKLEKQIKEKKNND